MAKDSNTTNTMREDIQVLLENIDQVIFGVKNVSQLILVAMICNDHVLLDDVPGMGKTLLLKTIAKLFDLNIRRVQGIPDLLPSDLLGVNIYNQKEQNFSFLPGPIFTNILIFDEINRASPKTQSALLEAMAENQVSIENKIYRLEKPFLVLATQNPIDSYGTYPLTQANLDRFLIRSKIGYPAFEIEKKILASSDLSLEELALPKFPQSLILQWQQEYRQVFIKDELLENLLKVIRATRNNPSFEFGISPRSAKKFVSALKAFAYIHGRDFVIKDDIYALFEPVFLHRLNYQSDETTISKIKQLLYEAKI